MSLVDDTYISKTLSWLLRHAAVKEGLEIASDGYIEVSKVLEHRKLRGRCSLNDVIHIVESNNKQRFNIKRSDDNVYFIRANQGHSIQDVSNLELTPILNESDVKNVIHGTFFKNWKSIKETGLNRMNRVHIHFTEGLPRDQDVISGMRSNCQVYIYINLQKALQDNIKFYKSANGVILTPGNHNGLIETKYFSKVIDAHTGFPNQISKENIEKFGASFGVVTNMFIGSGNRFAIFQFKDAKVADKLISMKKTFFMGKVVAIKPRKLQEPNPSDEAKPDEDYDYVLDMLRDLSNCSLSEQIKYVIHCLQPNREMKLRDYELLLDTLQRTLLEIFPWCAVHIFGSTITGLDFNNSDIDAYVGVENGQALLKPNQSSAVTFVKRAGSHLHKSRLFSHVTAIHKAKTPIVKCIHKQTGIACDFNFKNLLGVCNTTLINYYLSLDDKLRPLAIILKSWAKIQELIKSGGKLSSYSLTLMLIFFLQQDYSLPSVVELQQLRQYDNFQELWNGGFNYSFKRKLIRLNNATYHELLLGFFTFYSKFNFGLNMIAPFVGRSISKTAFLKAGTIPADYHLYLYNLSKVDPISVETAICVQDPFEHNHNATRGVSAKFLVEFVSLCNSAVAILQSPSDNYLLRLYTEEVEVLTDKLKTTDKDCEFRISLSSHISYLEAISSKENKSVENVWFDNVNSYMLMVLMKVFKLDVSVISDDDELQTKFIKLEGQVDVHNDTVDTLKIQCIGKRNFWEARKSVGRDLVFDECKTELDRQCFITQYMDDNLFKGVELDEPILDFIIILNAMQNPTRMKFHIINKIKGKTFKNFCLYFGKTFPLWFGKHEQESDTISKAEVAAEIVQSTLTV